MLFVFQGSHSIQELLQKSDAIIPKEQQRSTPVALKATAGLRLLPSNSSKQLLEEVLLFGPYSYRSQNHEI